MTTWSPQQDAIFDWFKTGEITHREHTAARQHLIVRARAGTGKTTTIIEGVKRAPERSILICAFSKVIQEELLKRVGADFPHVEAKTLHAVGYACVRRFRECIRVEFNSTRADALTDVACGRAAPDAVKRLVSKLHTKGREIAPHASKMGDLTSIAITFECEPDEQWERCTVCGANRDTFVHHVAQPNVVRHERFHHYAGFDATYVEQKALEAMELAANVKSGETIDGSDMIFLPVRNGWLTKQFDLVVVDEAQDMTTAQLEIAQGVLNAGGRICVVGDDRQAIFGFRGADSGSLDRLKLELGAAELGLTTTYRCGQAIVTLAQGYVPDFEAGLENPEGEVRTLGSAICDVCKGAGRVRYGHAAEELSCLDCQDGIMTVSESLLSAAGPGDFILSRVNAPLVSTAMKLLRAGKRTRVAGRDIGKGLITLIRKLKGRSVPDLLAKIEAWASRENARHSAQLAKAANGRKAAIQSKMEAILDQADMLTSLADGAANVAEVEHRIESLFTDDGLGAAGMITCSSVHRAKGLEANCVFILRDTLRENTVEEQNICYVAITRAKRELVWVTEKLSLREVK